MVITREEQKKDKCQGAVAWCSVGGSGFVRNEGLVKDFASSALVTKALAVLCSMIIWAKDRNWDLIHVCSNSLQPFDMWKVLMFWFNPFSLIFLKLACNFRFVVASMVPRTKVKAAHALPNL